MDANDAEASCNWTEQSSVWIGQTDMTVTEPGGDYDGSDPLQGSCFAYCLGADNTPDPRPEKVVLILNPITDSVTGTITFGEDGPPPPPTDPTKPYPPPTLVELADGATHQFARLWDEGPPYPGFSYSLVSSYATQTTGDVLHVAFAPSEVFRDWCALQDAAVPDAAVSPAGFPVSSPGQCTCAAGACRPTTGPIDRIDLTFDCNTMQGELLWQEQFMMLSSGPVRIRLQRVQ